MQKTKKGASEEADIKNKRNVELYKSGDRLAISRLYEDNYSFVKMQLKGKINGDDYLVEDLSQDVMMKMISNLDSYTISETKFRSWLSSICFMRSNFIKIKSVKLLTRILRHASP